MYLWDITSLPALPVICSSFTVAKAITLYDHRPPTFHTLAWKGFILPQVGSVHRRAVTSEGTGLGSRPKPNIPRLFIPRCSWTVEEMPPKIHNTFPLHRFKENFDFASFLTFEYYNSRGEKLKMSHIKNPFLQNLWVYQIKDKNKLSLFKYLRTARLNNSVFK